MVFKTVSRKFNDIYSGIILAGIMALAARYVAEHYGAPAMLMALLFGMSISSLSCEKTAVSEGIQFTASHILKLGIILLGSRISADIITILGWKTITLIVTAMLGTLIFGYIIGKSLGRTAGFAILTAGAVSICGASAAIAISSILPPDKDNDRNLLFTILCVTILSTIAMIAYPVLMDGVAPSEIEAGIFIGATIHDVAQVIGAGFSVSDEVGETATLVKLMRVSLLVPVVIGISILFRTQKSDIPANTVKSNRPVFPIFILGFIALATLNSLALLPEYIVEFMNELSSWALLTAIVAAGAKTNLKEILAFGYIPILLLILETLFLAAIVIAGLVIWY